MSWLSVHCFGRRRNPQSGDVSSDVKVWFEVVLMDEWTGSKKHAMQWHTSCSATEANHNKESRREEKNDP